MAYGNNTMDIKFILKRLEADLDSMMASAMHIQNEYVGKKASILACGIIEPIKDYRNYIAGVKDVTSKVEAENERLKEENRRLNSLYQKYKGKNEELKKEIEELKGLTDGRLSVLDETIKLINEDYRSLQFKKYVKDKEIDKSGVNSPRYRKDIDDEQLIKDYTGGMTLKEVSEKYKMSCPGMMNRLKILGVYKPVYGNNK